MYASLALAAAPVVSPFAGLRRDPAVGARLSSLRAFWPRSTYLQAIVPQGFAPFAAEADPRAGLEALVNQVLDAHAEAAAAIDRNGGSVQFSSVNASRALDTIAAWRNDHASELDALAKLPADTVVPDSLRLKLAPDEARAFVASLWITAHSGIGLYETGMALRAMEQGDPDWTPAKVNADLNNRLTACRLLAGMDAEGSLGPAMQGKPNAMTGLNGLGLTGLEIAIIIGIVVAIVGLFATYLHYKNDNYEQKQRIEAQQKLCAEARTKGDRATVDACNRSILEKPFSLDTGTVAILTVGGVALVWLLATFTLPKLLGRLPPCSPS